MWTGWRRKGKMGKEKDSQRWRHVYSRGCGATGYISQKDRVCFPFPRSQKPSNRCSLWNPYT